MRRDAAPVRDFPTNNQGFRQASTAPHIQYAVCVGTTRLRFRLGTTAGGVLREAQTGEHDMKFSIVSGVAALALALSTAAAFAQTQSGSTAQNNWTHEYNPGSKGQVFGPYDGGSANAKKTTPGQPTYDQGSAQSTTPPSAYQQSRAKTQ
jgi:hypothetical protein